MGVITVSFTSLVMARLFYGIMKAKNCALVSRSVKGTELLTHQWARYEEDSFVPQRMAIFLAGG